MASRIPTGLYPLPFLGYLVLWLGSVLGLVLWLGSVLGEEGSPKKGRGPGFRV